MHAAASAARAAPRLVFTAPLAAVFAVFTRTKNNFRAVDASAACRMTRYPVRLLQRLAVNDDDDGNDDDDVDRGPGRGL
jgi:hypothetical protein